jgi:hypothetical protein
MLGRTLLLTCILFPIAPVAYAKSSCSVPYQRVLARDGFAGLDNCRHGGRASATIAGKIQTPQHSYVVLDFRYTNPPTPGGRRHGGQRILIIQDGRHFAGQYALSPPPLRAISVKGRSIIVGVPHGQGNTVQFTESGPPTTAYLDQDEVQFSR